MTEAELLTSYLAQCDAPCPGCGYDLRGVEGGVCPECGAALRLALAGEARSRGGYVAGIVVSAMALGLYTTMLGMLLWHGVHWSFSKFWYDAPQVLLFEGVFGAILVGWIVWRKRLERAAAGKLWAAAGVIAAGWAVSAVYVLWDVL